MRRIALVSCLVLGALLGAWRASHIVDDIRYALQPEWHGTELALATDGTIDVQGRRMTVSAHMGVNCMPGAMPLPIPTPECSRPGFGAHIVAPGPPATLPTAVHARVTSEGETWATDLVPRPDLDRYDSVFDTQYAEASAQRETPAWKGRRPIQVTLWLEHRGQLYRVTLPASEILVAI